MKALKTFIGGVAAGICIAIGGAVFLSLDNKIVGALFFTVGLFTICTMSFNLFTGKVCYVLDNDGKYALNLLWIWLGNLVGCILIALLLSATRVGPALQEKAASLAATKLGDTWYSILILAYFCDILIYIAVDGFKNNPHELGKYLALFFGVAVFILCGFEHVVADMFYFSMGNAWSGKTVLYILIMTLGNSLGGITIPILKKLMK